MFSEIVSQRVGVGRTSTPVETLRKIQPSSGIAWLSLGSGFGQVDRVSIGLNQTQNFRETISFLNLEFLYVSFFNLELLYLQDSISNLISLVVLHQCSFFPFLLPLPVGPFLSSSFIVLTYFVLFTITVFPRHILCLILLAFS